ncbi:MAG: 5'-3' exonuclease H3TH domain-containing protein, partial [Candidatus Nanopelagicaceae bacterium]
MKKKLLILDGHSMAFRAFYALPVENFSTSSGQPTNAIYGFASMLINLIRDEKPTHIATAFDVSRKTFRSEKFPEYKANRAATPEEFRSQVSYINELLDAFAIPHFELEGFEADDVIATFVKHFSDEAEIYICSGDRDSFQLVSDQVTVLYPKKGVTELSRMTPSAVFEKYGLTPKQYPDFAALRGDPSDNLPSIPGVGEKTATKWIQEFGSLSELIAKVDTVPGKAGEALRTALPAVITNRELTQLRDDLPLSPDLTDLAWSGVEISKVNQLFEKLEIKALKARVAPFAKGGQVKEVVAKKASVRDISKNEFAKALSSSTGLVGLLLSETQAAISIEPELVLVAPLSEVSDLITSFEGFIFHGAKKAISSKRLRTVAVDTEVAAYLLNAGSRDIALADLLQKYLGVESENTPTDLFSTDWNPSIASHLGELWATLSKELEAMSCLDLYNQIEMPTMHVLAEMEATGIAIDKAEMKSLLSFFEKEEAEATSLAYKSVGHEFNAASPKQLQVVLFEELKLPKTKRIK